MLRTVEALATDWRRLDERVNEVSGEIEALAQRDTIGLGSLLILTLLCGAGLIYIGQQGSNRKQSFFRVQERLSEGQPVKQVEKPAQANVLPPSFDIASVDERGKLVAAGRSEAGWIIQLKSETQILAETKADETNGS